MKLTVSSPRPAALRAFLERQGALPFTYAAVGATRDAASVPGFDNDVRRVRLGSGPACFAAASLALRRWAMVPGGWVWIEPEAPIAVGSVVAMVARYAGLHWASAARIVYTIDEPDRFGFAYGTLPGHVESGEERFLIERDGDGAIWYDLRAFSRPRHPLVRLGYPLARRLQRRFAEESLVSMVRRCGDARS